MIPGIELHTIANMPPVTLGLLIMPMLMQRGGGGQSAGLMAALALVLPFLAQLWVARLAAEQMGVVIAGMAVSLLTTIAGLIGGILLRLEYNVADALVTDISQTAVSFTEVSLLPLLARGERDV